MNSRTVSMVLLVAGVVLLVLGFQEFGAFGSSLSRAVGRGPSTRAIALLACGGACAAFGALGLFKK